MTTKSGNVESTNVVKTEELSSQTGEVQVTNQTKKVVTLDVADVVTNDGFVDKNPTASVKTLAKNAENHQMDLTVKMCVSETNHAIANYRASQDGLFDAVRDAYFELKDDKEAMSKYKVLVDIDRSSINKIIAIVSNDTLIKFSKKLPVSWGTLYAVSKLETDNLVDAIEGKKLHPTSTLAQVKEVISSYSGKQSNDGEKKKAPKKSNDIEVNTCWVDLDELPNLSKKDSLTLIGLLGQLYAFGIQVTGVDLIDRKAA